MAKNPGEPTGKKEEEYHSAEENEENIEAEEERYNEFSDLKNSSVVPIADEKARQRKSLVIIAGLIAGVFCLYKLYGFFSLASSKKLPLLQKPAVIKTFPEPLKNLQPAEPDKMSEKSDDIKNREMQAFKILQLEKAAAQSAQALDNLQNQIVGLSSAITEIQNNVSMLSRQAADYAAQNKIKADSRPDQANQKKLPKKSHVRSKKSLETGMVYSLNAMVRGRAWLTSSTGEILTVSAGDELKGYGKIQVIDPDKAIVATESGKIIRFAPDDR